MLFWKMKHLWSNPCSSEKALNNYCVIVREIRIPTFLKCAQTLRAVLTPSLLLQYFSSYGMASSKKDRKFLDHYIFLWFKYNLSI